MQNYTARRAEEETQRAALLAQWDKKLLNGAPLRSHYLVEQICEDIGPLEDWPLPALQLQRTPLARHSTGKKPGDPPAGAELRFKCIVTLLVNGCDPIKLVDFLVMNNSLTGTDTGVTDVAGILFRHKCGTLGEYQVEMMSGASQRYAPTLYDLDSTVDIRTGILPGIDENDNAVYEETVMKLVRKAKGPKLTKKAERRKAKYDGVGCKLESAGVGKRMKLPKDKAQQRLSFYVNCKEDTASRIKVHALPYSMQPVLNHDVAICKVFMANGPAGHVLYNEAATMLTQLNQMEEHRRKIEDLRMAKAVEGIVW